MFYAPAPFPCGGILSIRANFSPADCQPCPARARCTRSRSRRLTLYPRDRHEAITATRARLPARRAKGSVRSDRASRARSCRPYALSARVKLVTAAWRRPACRAWRLPRPSTWTASPHGSPADPWRPPAPRDSLRSPPRPDFANRVRIYSAHSLMWRTHRF